MSWGAYIRRSVHWHQYQTHCYGEQDGIVLRENLLLKLISLGNTNVFEMVFLTYSLDNLGRRIHWLACSATQGYCWC